MKKIILLFIVLLFSIAGYFVWHTTVTANTQTILKPLPQKDPIADLKTLLHEKKIGIQSDPVASGSAMLVTLSSMSTEVLFSINTDLPTEVGSLQIILNKLTIEGKNARTIDLRFGDPIVVY